jgi:hypothetical protein
MPLELRERLLEAAGRSDRSLNAEIVRRLERSLEKDAVRCRRSSVGRIDQGDPRTSREGRGMSKRRLRFGLAGLTALVLVAAAAIMGLSGSGGSSQAASAELGEGPPALSNHLAALKQAMPGNSGMANEGPASAAEADFRERAYPDTTISVAEMEGARDAFAAASARGSSRNAVWTSIGPSRALYPVTPFRNSFGYVPN